MKNKTFIKYYLFSCIGVLFLSFYPLCMGYRVVRDMIINSTVMKEDYPKYIIPYTPICVSIIICVLLMPLVFKLLKRFALLGASVLSTAVFFICEFLLERNVVITSTEIVSTLEDWQMYMCYIPPESFTTTYKTQTAVDILMGEYNPAFKLHFYAISIVLILAILNCIYGFAQTIKTGQKARIKALILQSVSSFVFLALCVLACFTAFFRDGSIEVSPLSAFLMAVFFVLFGITSGIFTASFLLGKKALLSTVVPSVVALLMTGLMYAGEMVLLNGHLYKMGDGFFFDSIQAIVFAPVDILIILASGAITLTLSLMLNRKK